jgi:hypothetical protein
LRGDTAKNPTEKSVEHHDDDEWFHSIWNKIWFMNIEYLYLQCIWIQCLNE